MNDHASPGVSEFSDLTESLRVFDRNDHPDITDRFGRVWVWHHWDTYVHDGLISCLGKFIDHPDMQLPNRKLAGNPNYAGLCATCRSEW